MLSRYLATRPAPTDPIRWRGREPNRIESLSDAVFGFAITLLVFSVEVPKSYSQLQQLMRGIPSFVFSMAVIAQLWWRHCVYFRRYALHDRTVMLLNTILLITVVVYVYPLKFLFDYAFVGLLDPARAREMVPTFLEQRRLLTTYAAGSIAVFGVFALMSLHAYRLREAIAPAESQITLEGTLDEVASIGAAILVLVLTWVLPDRDIFYALLGLLGLVSARVRRRFRSR